MPWTLNLRTDEARAKIAEIILESQQETFEKDILTEAENLSPVRTGVNVSSIQTETYPTEQGPKSELYTTDGYGGFLEVGTKKMKAQPYLYPAFLHGIINLPQRIYRRIHG
jgi:hypothetical protein